MLARLAAAGYRVRAWNRSSAARLALQPVQAAHPGQVFAACDPVDAVGGADLIVTMLSDGPAVRAVLFGDGENGMLADHLAADSCLVDMSSIPPAMAREHAEWLEQRKVHALDAPVSGGVVGARDGTLAIMAGGSPAALAKAITPLTALGRVTHVGPAGAGQLAKLANQVIVGVTIGAVAEALLLAARGGADARAVREAIRGGFAESRILDLHGARMLEEDFAPGGAVHTQLKDLETAVETARSAGLDLPITRLLRDLFAAARGNGDGGLDHAALLRELGRRNHLPEHGLLVSPPANGPKSAA